MTPTVARRLVMVVAIALPALIAAWPFTQGGDWMLNPDGSLYSALAEAVYKGQGYVLTDGSFPAFRPPLMAILGVDRLVRALNPAGGSTSMPRRSAGVT